MSKMDFITRCHKFGRCPICDWPMSERQEDGCIPGDCCYRPDDPAEQQRIKERRRALALSPALCTPTENTGK